MFDVIIRNEYVAEIIKEKDGTWAYEVSENVNNFNDAIQHTDDHNYVLY